MDWLWIFCSLSAGLVVILWLALGLLGLERWLQKRRLRAGPDAATLQHDGDPEA